MFEDEGFVNLNPLIKRFESMVKNNHVLFFDVDEFEALSDYYFESGRVDDALKVVEMGDTQHPANSSFTVRKAQYYTATDQINQAEEQIAKLESISPGSFDLFMARAAINSKKGNHQKAIQFYKQALQHAEFPEDVWPMMAIEYQLLGNFDLALKYLKLALDINADDEIAVYNIALCYDLLEKPKEGIVYFKKFIDLNPYSEIAWYHLGILHAKKREYEEALRSVDYAILIDETFIAAYYEKARILERTFRYQEAAETYESSFEFDGPTGYSYYKMGLCFLKMHKDTKAHSYFTKASQEDPDLDEAFYELALLNDENREAPEAIFHITKALELDPDNWDYLFTSADIHKRGGLLNEAEIIYKELIFKGFEEPQVYIDYAELLFDLCEFEQGMDLLYRGIEMNPESAEMHFRLSGYLFTLSENDEASIYFQKALKLDPDRRKFFFELFPKLEENPAIIELLSKFLKP